MGIIVRALQQRPCFRCKLYSKKCSRSKVLNESFNDVISCSCSHRNALSKNDAFAAEWKIERLETRMWCWLAGEADTCESDLVFKHALMKV